MLMSVLISSGGHRRQEKGGGQRPDEQVNLTRVLCKEWLVGNGLSNCVVSVRDCMGLDGTGWTGCLPVAHLVLGRLPPAACLVAACAWWGLLATVREQLAGNWDNL